MKPAVEQFVSPQQLGLLEGTEKAFDRASWKYLADACALDFGDSFRSLARLFANPYAPPPQEPIRVRVNGVFSTQFRIHLGVPQGCRFSPLAFLATHRTSYSSWYSVNLMGPSLRYVIVQLAYFDFHY
eukprot:6189792-Pleurochrysis_carterae.AAC.1